MFHKTVESSSLLDLEAADYFKLDSGQLQLLSLGELIDRHELPVDRQRPKMRRRDPEPQAGSRRKQQQSATSTANIPPSFSKQPPAMIASSSPKKTGRDSQVTGNASRVDKKQQPSSGGSSRQATAKTRSRAQSDSPGRGPTIKSYQRLTTARLEPKQPSGRHSPSTSTSSLPSVSSSPSLAPSLVCPHLSLDDILDQPTGSGDSISGRRSAHTIGLCSKCRLDPPPNVQSPLSPAFRPSLSPRRTGPTKTSYLSSSDSRLGPSRAPTAGTNRGRLSGNHHRPPQVRRNHSDLQTTTLKRSTSNLSGSYQNQQRNRKLLRLPNDDSLDCCLEPDDLRRLQMSPTMRHSVEYIRNNPTEAGRVLTIYKNGRPFDKPLRICIKRGEFANINHLLDHINSRQLVPLGARYLFHLDGQLVYSEHELKHGSSYIVSGTRNFEFAINCVVKNQATSRIQVSDRLQIADTSKSLAHSQVKSATQVKQPLRSRQAHGSRSPMSRRQQEAKSSDLATNAHEQMVKAKKPLGGQLKRTPTTTGSREKTIRAQPKTTTARRSEPMSQSNESLVSSNQKLATSPSRRTVGQSAKGSSLVRAKSELSGLPAASRRQQQKRKKNVTFMDTGRGSSPALNQVNPDQEPGGSREKDSTLRQETIQSLETNEIGIQVSDSIEGFLIDLPIALPPTSGAESRRLPAGARRRGQLTGGGSPKRNSSGQQQQRASLNRKRGQVVTIAERQLSFDEMDKLRDLDHGDHHSEAHKIQHVSITLDEGGEPDDEETGGAGKTKLLKDEASQATDPIEAIAPDRSNTIVIGQEPGGDLSRADPELQLQWQPLDSSDQRAAGSSPSERPVSQSDANELVHARVSTPSPSLSTMGDSNSLALSYDYSSLGGGRNSAASGSSQLEDPAAARLLPAKQRPPVRGRQLGSGLEMPGKNFQLVWVNGFSINDLYPENSIAAAAATLTRSEPSSSPSNPAPGTPLLSPAAAAESRPLAGSPDFKPSERFANWVWHSRRHDELIYPAGALVVLWCRLTGEQRYYSRHSSNVSALCLSSLDDDLAASAQVGDPPATSGPAAPRASIHLWSLSSLSTVHIVDDDQFRGGRIFSLRLRNTQSDGCELSVGSRDDRRLWLQVFSPQLKSPEAKRADKEASGSEAQSERPKVSPKRRKSLASAVIKASKPLQSSQTPLLIARLSSSRQAQAAADPQSQTAMDKANEDGAPYESALISFGRRHFQVWFADRRRQTLAAMQPADANKSPPFVEAIVGATCLARVSPSELLVGDSSGNLTLLVVSFQKQQQSETKSKLANPVASATSHKYLVEATRLLPATSGASSRPAITSVARVSGSLFVRADAACGLSFWRLNRQAPGRGRQVDCAQLGSIRLPRDFGFTCSILLAKYSGRKQPLHVEFYLITTSNAILFGSVQLQQQADTSGGNVQQQADNYAERPPLSCNLCVVYEGHEAPAMSLVADFPVRKPKGSRRLSAATGETTGGDGQKWADFFTCSLDCKICKWNGKQLIWKSMLPSACASLAVHPTGFVLAIGSADGTVYILDKISGLLISYFPLTPVCINCLAYSRDGSLLAAGCANGSVFIMPVYERGLKYKKVSILQSPHPVVSLQFSLDNKYMLTSVTHGSYQELILWDLPNFRYMRKNVRLAADRIEWFDAICSGSEDVRAIWENANIQEAGGGGLDDESSAASPRRRLRRLSLPRASEPQVPTKAIINLSCHRLIRSSEKKVDDATERLKNFVIAGDTRGYLRLFRYPCSDIQQSCYEARVSSSAVSCCRFLAPKEEQAQGGDDTAMFVSSSLDGSVCLWTLC